LRVRWGFYKTIPTLCRIGDTPYQYERDDLFLVCVRKKV